MNLLTLLCHDDLVALVRLQRRLVSTLLVIIGRFDVHALLHNEVPWLSVLLQNALLGIDGSLLINEAHENEAETASSPGSLVSHYNSVFHFAILFEVSQQFLFGCLKSEAANKQLNLIFFGWLVELCS